LEWLEYLSLPSTIVLNNPPDTPVFGQTDLREAIVQAETTGGDETIVFDSTVFSTPQTITLTGGQLELSDTTGTETITGPAAGVTISGNNTSRVFAIDTGVSAALSGLTITGGSTGTQGGGLDNSGTTTLTNCTIMGNSVTNFTGGGGGLYDTGTTTLTNSTASGNATGDHGAGGGHSITGTATTID